MSKRGYIFVDAENHVVSSKEVVADFFDLDVRSHKAVVACERWAAIDQYVPRDSFPNVSGRSHPLAFKPEYQLFWDPTLLSTKGELTPLAPLEIERGVFVGSCVGSEEKVREMRIAIRSFGFEPVVIKEAKADYNQREQSLERCNYSGPWSFKVYRN